ncbi:MAG: hypothetical protein ACRDZ3_19455 [Acidimicrobiia bacterium]
MTVFAVWCARHRARVLLSTSSILSLHSGPDGIGIAYRCTCGYEGFNAARSQQRPGCK